MLGNLNDPKAPPQRREMEDATRALELKVIAPEIRTPDDIHGAIEVLANARVDLVIVLQTAMMLSERRRVAELMAAKRLPAIYGYRDHVDDGGLISYGVNVNWIFRRSATYVHKILSGDAPSDLPVEFPTRLEMVVNLKAAKAIGFTIPESSLIVRADEVIE